MLRSSQSEDEAHLFFIESVIIFGNSFKKELIQSGRLRFSWFIIFQVLGYEDVFFQKVYPVHKAAEQ